MSGELKRESSSRAPTREELAEQNEEMLFADGFDEALIGVVERCGQPTVALYDANRVLEILVREGATEEDALEHFQFNVLGAWMGDNTPAFATLVKR